jgi:RND family efflux transporter MFP subunit
VKTSSFILAIVALALVVLGTSLSVAGDAPAKTLYTCGMHPQVIQDHPGNCPICGMKLTPIHPGASTEATADSTHSAVIAVDAATRQNMNLRTATVAAGPLHKVVRTVGTVDYNETALADVTTKFKGWVEKLDVDATGQLVHRGEPMFEIYSPDLYSAEAEYLLTLHGAGTNDAGAAELRETAATKLKFFDVPDAEIASLAQSGVARKTLPVTAPIYGFVIEKNVVQGQMVDAGMRLYRIADLAVVWVMAEIYEQDLPFVQLGQEAVVKAASLPDREFRGRVTYIYPTVDEKTRTARVRLEFENPGYFLKPGMFVSAEIQAELPGSAVLVPDAAVLRSGARNTVFVALSDGRFEPRDVTLGVEAEGSLIQVLAGLQAGERIVISGQFLLDSESQLREAIDKMQGTPAETRTMAASNTTNGTNVTPSAVTAPETTVYVCPMPEHVSIVYDHPGTCPICGMALVPVTPSALKKIQPGGKVLYYVCPMPEHANVHQDKPGKCPLCGMTLVPIMSKPETSAATNAPAAKKYYCPMHPEVVSDHPGKCPKCEMDLVPVP